jgi:putative ABC transport system ATP-binding protein
VSTRQKPIGPWGTPYKAASRLHRDKMSHHGEGPYKLEVRKLTLDLEGNRILDEVDMGIQEGESFCVLGGSGAGKSMLLRTIVRLHEPASGEVLLDGSTICELEPSTLRRRVNLVQQSPAMLDGTVEDNIMYGLDLAGVPPEEARERAAEALRVSALDPSFLCRRADKLSGGERQRVAIARAYALRPEVLLLDEPTAALDPRRTREVETTILHLKEGTNMTLVIVTHDIEQARRLGDRTIMLRQGRVVAEGDSSTLLEGLDPEERAGYLGELERGHTEDGEGDGCE